MNELRLRAFFDALCLLTRVTGGRRLDDRLDAGGFEGAVNFEITGDGGGSWHADLAGDRIRFERGAHPAPKATILVPRDTFLQLLSGKTSWITAQMTGKVRVRGDGHAGMLLGGLVTQFRTMADKPGLPGRIARLWQRLVTG